MGAVARVVGVLSFAAALVVGCGATQKHSHALVALSDPHAVRYRLRLRDNPVDAGEAFRCYGRCQSEKAPQSYLACLVECPGFEKTTGMRCDATEVPPESACFTVRRQPASTETPPGMVVIAVVAGVALVVALSSLCTSSTQQCGYYQYPPPH